MLPWHIDAVGGVHPIGHGHNGVNLGPSSQIALESLPSVPIYLKSEAREKVWSNDET